MKICVISSTILPCPLKNYGGLEQIAYLQAKGLAERGHEVMLVAPGEESVPPPGAELHRTTIGEPEGTAYHGGYKVKLANYDVIIDNSWNKYAYLLKAEGKLGAPILGVCHAPIHTMYNRPPPIMHPCLVAISQDMVVAINEHLGVPARLVYNSIDLDHYKVKPDIKRTDRYLFLARMSSIKGPHIAVDMARKLRFGLDLVGDDTMTNEPDLAQRLRMQAQHNITYHGGVSRDKTVDFYSAAKAMLHPALNFREPFGLAPVEAQACGTPVLAFDNGAMRETIVHGESGFVVKTIPEMEELIKTDAVRSLKAEACRTSAERFSVKRMVDGYEQLCREAIDGAGW